MRHKISLLILLISFFTLVGFLLFFLVRIADSCIR